MNKQEYEYQMKAYEISLKILNDFKDRHPNDFILIANISHLTGFLQGPLELNNSYDQTSN